jgi:hypothetical protein
MKKKMFTVYDSKTETYLNPFYMLTKGECIRSWTETLNDPLSSFCKYPADYNLFEIGEYDDSTCTVTMLESKINLGNGLEFKNAQL